MNTAERREKKIHKIRQRKKQKTYENFLKIEISVVTVFSNKPVPDTNMPLCGRRVMTS